MREGWNLRLQMPLAGCRGLSVSWTDTSPDVPAVSSRAQPRDLPTALFASEPLAKTKRRAAWEIPSSRRSVGMTRMWNRGP